MNMNEIWKDIVGYEGSYQVSNLGNVRSLNYNGTGVVRNLKHGIGKSGYPVVTLSNKGKLATHTVHRLVAIAFIPNPHCYGFVNHKDETRTNNVVDNLEWCTQAYNNTFGTCKQREAESKSYPVEQLFNGVLVKRWKSTKDAQRYGGFRSGCISLCCNGYRATHKGYEWRYAT